MWQFKCTPPCPLKPGLFQASETGDTLYPGKPVTIPSLKKQLPDNIRWALKKAHFVWFILFLGLKEGRKSINGFK